MNKEIEIKNEYPPLEAANDYFDLKKDQFHIINDAIYTVKNNIFNEFNEEDLMADMIDFMDTDSTRKYVRKTYLDTMSMCLQSKIKKESKYIGECEPFNKVDGSGFYIPVENGYILCSWKNDEYCFKLEDYNDQVFITNKLNVKYNPKKIAKRFRKMLVEVCPDPEQRNFLQEFIGYSLIRDTSHNIMVNIFGPGGNGKSALLAALKPLYGINGYRTLTISELQGKENYKLADVENIFINLCDEIPEDKNISTDKIKNMTSGGEIIVRAIYKAPKKIKVVFKLLFCSNCLPKFTDRSDAIFRRFVIINFPNQFKDPKKRDPRLTQEDFWIQSGEVEGILNWALEGLKRLQERGHFEEPKYSKITKQRYRLELNPERQFVTDYLQYTGKVVHQISTAKIYKAYEDYCKDFGINKKSEKIFGEEVRRMFPKVEKTGLRNDKEFKRKLRYWKGIVLINKFTEKK